MRYKFPTLGHYLRATVKDPDQWLRFNLSPGGAANMLGCTRQNVHKHIKSGFFDVVITDDGYILLDEECVKKLTSVNRGRNVA